MYVIADRLSGLCHWFIGFEVDLFIFDGVPESFYKDVVSPATLTIHTDADVVRLKFADEGLPAK